MQAKVPDHVWTYDFLFDQTFGATTLKILTLTDEFTRESLALRVAASFKRTCFRTSSRRVAHPDSSGVTTTQSVWLVTWASGWL